MNIVAITSCIAGIAHTPMAAKALEKAADKMGYRIKVEQQGAMGIVNEITAEEAKNADFVLLASDKTVSGMDRFDGKKILKVKIAVALKKPEALLEKCVQSLNSN